MKVRVLSCAEREFAEAVDYYNAQQRGLGFEFAAEIKCAFERIAAFPNAWPRFSDRSRRYLVSRFPYGVLHQIRAEDIVVLVIMDLRRDPERWRERSD